MVCILLSFHHKYYVNLRMLGLAADLVKTKLSRPRSYCLVLISTLFILSQLVAAHVGEPENLWQSSTLLGLAYGMIFGLMPILVIEWFGLSMCWITGYEI